MNSAIKVKQHIPQSHKLTDLPLDFAADVNSAIIVKQKAEDVNSAIKAKNRLTVIPQTYQLLQEPVMRFRTHHKLH